MASGLDRFTQGAVSVGAYASERRLRYYTQFLLGDCSGIGHALDIGGGAGILSFYLAACGASRVLLLEPDAEGASEGNSRLFQKLSDTLPNSDRVLFLDQTYQEFDPGDDTFDLVVSVNSINHIDEAATAELRVDPASRSRYLSYFEKLHGMMNPGGRLVIADCTPRNLFHSLGMTNPFHRTIEWHKHQPPEQWISLLEAAGFVDPNLEWSTYNFLGRIGQRLMGNPFVSYLTLSHFKLTIWKP